MLALGELVDAGLLERVERTFGVPRMMTVVLAGAPLRQRPVEAAEQEDREGRPRERLSPTDADETKNASG